MEGGAKQKKLKRLDREKAQQLQDGGCDVRYIAEQCGVVPVTVRNWLKKTGQEANGGRKTVKKIEDRTQLEQDAYDAYKMGMTYGVFKSCFPFGLTRVK